jgi:uncharacterized membrane protein
VVEVYLDPNVIIIAVAAIIAVIAFFDFLPREKRQGNYDAFPG